MKFFVSLVPILGAAACSLGAPDEASSAAQQLASARAVSPDPTETGPLAVTSAEYRFPAAVDADVIDGRATELWAHVYRPENLEGPHPVVVILHGNHATCGTGQNPRRDTNCDYTDTGMCPSGFVVVPNHLGYAYVAEKLASHGYVVVSINANRGITCGGGVGGDGGLNLARGRLILKHLQRLSEWNAQGGTPASLGVELQGKLDFSQVGLIGHSRGGEGVRAAYNQYRDLGSPWPTRITSPVTFRGLFEIGPVDGQTDRVLDADGTVWSVLLPMCDGDVSNLAGIRPYDRVLRIPTDAPATPKSTFTVWGANHNFYNTEWQQSDSQGCAGHTPLFPATIGSPEQRTTGLASIMAFIRANVGVAPDPSFHQVFDPHFDLPAVVTDVARVDRGYTDSPNANVTTVFEDFDRGVGTNTHGTPNAAAGITITHGTVPNHDSVQRAGLISWQAASTDAFFQTNWTAAGDGRDASSFKTLDIRVSRQQSNLNPVDPTNFSIQLVAADGALSEPVALRTYTDLRGPVGGRNNIHPILQSARIPLTDFVGADLTNVRGARFVFDDTASGAIYLGNVRLSNVLAEPALAALSAPPAAQSNAVTPTNGAGTMPTHTQGNAIKEIRRARPSQASSLAASEIEIELETAENFPVRDELPVLRIGDREFSLSRHPGGDTRRIVFTLPSDAFAPLRNGDDVSVHYGERSVSARWLFGPLDKRALR